MTTAVAMLIAGCGTSATGSTSDGSASETTNDTGPPPSGTSGDVTLIVRVASADGEPDVAAAADALAAAAQHYGFEPIVRAEGATVLVTLRGARLPDVDPDMFTTGGDVQLRPVIGCTGPIESSTTEASSVAHDSSNDDFLPLLDEGGGCEVGPVAGDGRLFEPTASIEPAAGAVGISLTLRADGEDAWNAIAEACFSRVDTCPSGQLAIVVDGVVISAPLVQAPEFSGAVTISGVFDEVEAARLALALNAGALRSSFKVVDVTISQG